MTTYHLSNLVQNKALPPDHDWNTLETLHHHGLTTLDTPLSPQTFQHTTYVVLHDVPLTGWVSFLLLGRLSVNASLLHHTLAVKL